MNSSWIESIRYRRIGESTYIAVFTRNDSVILYKDVPHWMPGLLSAGTPRKEDRRETYHSPGRAYNKLLKGKYPSQVVKDEVEVNELKQLFQ